MCVVQSATTTVFVAFMSMPLLTELVSSEDDFCYRHDAPNEAVPPKPALHSTEEQRRTLVFLAARALLGAHEHLFLVCV